ncbi:MAG TPA: S41 family peptidase [Chitinophaga sp.]|uniref:S41 family peptidase n=1 Tax=Chitinophaga sp. TaxID=1869181 RepID=UPI002BDC603C|nr:S41 family peptidase [Chitinophaga sp.]HVI48304.1 S41 family peptidase [Chitinophaga sp.]
MKLYHTYRCLIPAVLLVFLASACKKHDSPSQPQQGNINDSIYFVFKDIYLWNDAIPDSATFKPESYGSVNAMYEALLQYKKYSTGRPIDKYSFLDDGTTSRTLQGAVAGNVGFEVGFQTNTSIYVVYVYPGSPADKAGIRRGWQVTNINGVSSFSYRDPATNNLLNQTLGGTNNSSNFTFRKPDGNTQNNVLQPSTYSLNPVLYSHVYDFNGTKVGYFVFNSFVALRDIKAEIDSIFDAFTAAGVTRLVVDLRYNGGGLLETAEYLANKMVPASKTNTVMYTQSFNSNILNKTYSRYFANMKAVPYYPNVNWSEIFYEEATTYSTVKFAKTGSMALTNLSFLVTRNTVSASELLYNVLRPSLSPRLVGDSTYGKPVGFINITFGNYDMYAVSFQTFNASGEGNYFDGFKPDVAVLDDYSKDWGDLGDPLLRGALTDMGIPTSLLGRAATTESNRLGRMSTNLKGNSFKGMIQTIRH